MTRPVRIWVPAHHAYGDVDFVVALDAAHGRRLLDVLTHFHALASRFSEVMSLTVGLAVGVRAYRHVALRPGLPVDAARIVEGLATVLPDDYVAPDAALATDADPLVVVMADGLSVSVYHQGRELGSDLIPWRVLIDAFLAPGG